MQMHLHKISLCGGLQHCILGIHFFWNFQGCSVHDCYRVLAHWGDCRNDCVVRRPTSMEMNLERLDPSYFYSLVHDKRFLVNKFLLSTSIHAVEQKTEWAYCFDVHCNGFVPIFLLTYLVQFFFLPILHGTGLIATILSNTLYLTAVTSYWYITFLGYSGEWIVFPRKRILSF
jgi:hypothetical protein